MRGSDVYDDEDDDEAGDSADPALLPCPSCHAEIHEDSVRCPHCGDYVTFNRRPWSNKPVWLRRLAVILVLLAVAGLVLLELRHWLGFGLPQPGGPPGILQSRE